MLLNQYIVFCYSEHFITNFIPCFLLFSFGLLGMALFVLKHECYLLKTLLSDMEARKRKQHTFETFGQIK